MFIRKSLLAVSLTAAISFSASAAAQEQKPKPQVLFTNVNIFDGKTDKLAMGMNDLVEGNHQTLKSLTSIGGKLAALTGNHNPYPFGNLSVIEEGAYADLLIVDGNPLKDIMIMTKPGENFRVIMKDGKIYKNTLH